MDNNNQSYPLMDFVDESEVWEESVLDINRDILDILLKDRTSKRNILWATDEYASYGAGYEFSSEIRCELISGSRKNHIQPRVTKETDAQTDRTKDKAEVFTPSWICNKQNNLVDSQWFGRENVFNIEKGTIWETVKEKISFDGSHGDWKKYIDAQRLEVSCGEAPYLVSRYDTVTGTKIPLMDRIGFLDRKMRIVQENTSTAEEWLAWSQRAFESVYAYEFQGDSLLLARKNLLYSYIDYYVYRFKQYPGMDLLKKIAQIISWNVWQMDGTKCVIPGSCKPVEVYQLSLFDFMDDDGYSSEEEDLTCPGCKTGNVFLHTGTYCKIMDWRAKRSCKYVSMMKGGSGRDVL